jgi:hypothetical protein
MNSEGVVRLVSLDSAAAAMSLPVLPDDGTEWIVIWGYGFHNDNAGPHNMHWRWVDANPIRVGTPITIDWHDLSIALNLELGLNAWRADTSMSGTPPMPEPIIITHNVHPTLIVDAMGATKILSVRMCVCERSGIGS